MIIGLEDLLYTKAGHDRILEELGRQWSTNLLPRVSLNSIVH